MSRALPAQRLAPTAPAALPPADLAGIDPSWSRLVTATDADGVPRTWHVMDAGVAEHGTLLCVHGNPTWGYLWRRLLAAPPAGWRVIAVDQLEMGFSERTGVHRGLPRRVDDLGRLTDALALEGPVVTVGHDWGGPISLGWALAHRDQLAGVVLANTAVHQPDHDAVPAVIRAARGRGVLETVCTTTTTFLDAALALTTPRVAGEDRAGFRAPYLGATRRHGIAAFVRDIPLQPSHPSAAALDAIAAGVGDLDVPALLLWGPSDPVFADRYLHDLEARLPHADVERVVGASHLSPEEVDLPDLVDSWLRVRLGAPGAAALDLEALRPTSGTADRAGRHTAAPASDPTRVPIWAALGDASRAERLAVAEPDTGDGPGARRTFADLEADTAALAAGLADHGVEAGARVALLIPPGVELATALYACWRRGAVPVLADAGLGARGITQALKAAAPAFVIGIPRALAAARALRWPGELIASASTPNAVRTALGVGVGLDDLQARGATLPAPATPSADADAAMAFTSGATGPSKGVVYTHRQLEAQREAIRQTYAITDEDRLVAAFAPFALYGPALGIPSLVPDMDVTAPGTLTASALTAAVDALDATLVFASPAALRNVVATADEVRAADHPALAHVRLLLSAGAPVPAELLRAMGDLLPAARAHTPYGMTEALPAADIDLEQIELAARQAPIRDGVCVGPPIQGVTVRIDPLDDQGQPRHQPVTQTGITGEVLVAGAHVRDRYDRRFRAQLAAGRDPGWHRTGDVGHLDDQGRLWIEGRLAHVVTTAAGVVTPVGVERAVETTVGHLTLAAAVGVGPVGTQQLVVVVQTDPVAPKAQLAPASLARAVRDAVAAAGITAPVASVLAVPHLPVDIRHQSKIDRGRLAAWATDILAGARIGAP